MTYFEFLIKYLIVPILLLLMASRWLTINSFPQYFWRAVWIHVLLALVYTTPWDNYLVATGVWYYNPALVTGITIGYVPIEEYTFFILETIFAGLWWRLAFVRFSDASAQPAPVSNFNPLCAALLMAVWSISAWQLFRGPQSLTYISIILFWALPAILPQILFGADILWRRRKLITLAILPLGLYLSFVDSLAIYSSTWTIASSQSTGILLGGILPLEEALFFFVTVTLVTFGLTLLLVPESATRFEQLKVKVWRLRL